MTIPPLRFRNLSLAAAFGAMCAFVGCASFGMEDVPAYVSVASRVVGAVAKAEQSRRVTDARRRCGELEEAAAAAHDVETAAALLRELADAQRDLADALEADGSAPGIDGGR